MNPYFLDGPAVVSFSGGRTSGLMLYKILEAHDGKLPEDVVVIFANTGREMPETLDFVNDCSTNWNVPIIWVERYANAIPDDTKKYGKKYSYETIIVDYEHCSRNGLPFEALIQAKAYAPNPVARFCTVELKIRAISDYMKTYVCGDEVYTGAIGIRADEERRAHKMHGTKEGKQERYLPLWLDGITKHDVFDFWESQNFDLNLPNNNGTTDWGNCDLCFLKGFSKKLSIIKARPDLADWWIEQEKSLSKKVGKAAFFRADQPSYSEMKIIASDQGSLFGFDDETIPCFCGD